MSRLLTTFILVLAGTLASLGQNLDTVPHDVQKEEANKIEDWKGKLPFNFSGSVDAYVQSNFVGKQTNTVANEAFPTKANSFELGMINLMMSKEIGKVGFMADIGFGPRAEAANNTIYSNTILAIKQLYMTYAPTDWVKLTLGNFSTYFGYELIEPTNNFHYSTSLAFQNGPFYHTGIKANFTKGKFNFMTGFFNDTDTKSDDDRNKYVGAQAGYTGEKASVYLNYIGGNEPDTSLERKYKSGLGLTTTMSLGKEKKGSIALDVAYYRWRLKASKDDNEALNADFFTSYIYGKCDFNNRMAIGARVGYLYNPDGFTPYVAASGTHFADLTLSYHYHIGPLRLQPEFRLDYCNDKVFVNRDGEGSNLQYRLMMAAIFGF